MILLRSYSFDLVMAYAMSDKCRRTELIILKPGDADNKSRLKRFEIDALQMSCL